MIVHLHQKLGQERNFCNLLIGLFTGTLLQRFADEDDDDDGHG